MSRHINEEFYGDKSFSYGGKYRLYEEFDTDKVDKALEEKDTFRICEHLHKARNLNTDSVIVQHWAEHHGTQITSPAFEYKILNKFKDPLRRQICEAIHIQDQGTLNRKSEFNMNELCRLEVKKHWRDMESQVRSEAESKTVFVNKIANFVDVMNNVLSNKSLGDDQTTCCRSKRPQQWSGEQNGRKRRRTTRMNC